MGGIGGKLKQIADPGNLFGGNPNSPFALKPNLPNIVGPKAAAATAQKGMYEGNVLLKRFQQGKLSPGEQAVINSYKKSAGAELAQEMGSAGLSKSSAAALSKGAISEQGAAMAEQFLQQDLQSSMDFMGMTMNSYYQNEALDVQQNQSTMGALGGLATAVGSII